MMHRAEEARSVWSRDLGAHAKRLLALFGAGPTERKRRKDDDDDLPRPNAVNTSLFGVSRFASA